MDLLLKRSDSSHFGWALAIGPVLLAICVQYLALPIISLEYFLLLYPTLYVVAWLSGLLPSTAAVFLATFSAYYVFYPPHFSMKSLDFPSLIRLVIFFLSSMSGVMLIAEGKKRIKRSMKEASDITYALNASSIVAMTDASGTITFANDKFCEISQFSREELIGKNHRLINSGYHSKKFFHHLWQTILAGKVWHGEIRNRTKNGTYYWVDTNIVPLIDETGRPAQFVAIRNDITARKQAEDALIRAQAELRESEELFRSMVNFIPHLAWMASPDGTIFWYNQRWYDFTGTDFEEMQGDGWKKIHHPDHLERVVSKFKECLKAGRPWEDIHPMRRKDGVWRWFLTRALSIRDQAGMIIRWFGSNTDITGQLKTEDELRDSIRARDEFIAIISHELKTPLTSLKLQTQMFKRELVKKEQKTNIPPKVIQLVEQTERHTNRLTRLVDDMLEIGKIRAGKLAIHQERVALDQLARDVVHNLKHELVKSETRIDLLCSEHVEGLWDSFRIEQVLFGLLSNAIKYGNQRPITLTIKRHNDMAHIEVKDQGLGIDQEMLEKIFERFERGISYHAVSGLGLGLFISRQIVTAHAGHIWAESPGKGKGSTFHVELPLYPREYPEESPPGFSRERS